MHVALLPFSYQESVVFTFLGALLSGCWSMMSVLTALVQDHLGTRVTFNLWLLTAVEVGKCARLHTPSQLPDTISRVVEAASAILVTQELVKTSGLPLHVAPRSRPHGYAPIDV